jgi:ribose transport system permease protein
MTDTTQPHSAVRPPAADDGASGAPGPAGPGAGRRVMLTRLAGIRELTLAMILALTCLVLSLALPNFAAAGNLRAMIIGMVPACVIAVGMTILLVSGGFDLSVAAVMALCGTTGAYLAVNGWPVPVAFAAAIALGALIGAFNGALIAGLGINPLVATLGTLTAARGIALVMTDGYNISNLPSGFLLIGEQGPLALPWMVWITLVLLVISDVLLRKARFLRQLYYIGGNERAARLSGIAVARLRVGTYTASGALASVAGILLVARLNTAVPTAGTGLELVVIAAAVIGGASLAGGEGSILGATLGVAFLSVIGNAVTLLDISIFWQEVVTGAALVVAVSLDMLIRRRRR